VIDHCNISHFCVLVVAHVLVLIMFNGMKWKNASCF
jgi:hypothetical protein